MATTMAKPTPMADSNVMRLPGSADMVDVSDAPLPPAALKKLLAWLSPNFPIGGFSYSHGLEWAVEDGTVTNATGLEAWLGDILSHGAGWSDAVLFHHAHRACARGDVAGAVAINELAVALQPSRERHLESTAQGRAFLSTVAATWPNDRLKMFAERLSEEDDVAYPVSAAVACAAHDIPAGPATNAYLAAFVANIVSAAARAVPIGQTDCQRVIAALSSRVEHVAALSASADLGDLGGCVWLADIASMKHETQYTRLFRS
jgi:urease accessory protein